jgi:hypothetical protein
MANPEFVEDGEEDVVDIIVADGTWKYHDYGTGTTAPVKGNTAMETACGESRTTGTAEEGATADIYKSIGTHTFAGSFAITEAGLFESATVGVLIVRGTFSAINVGSGDKIETTYTIQFA